MQAESTVRAGIRVALPVVLPTLALGISFGIIARPLMGGAATPVAMSILVFSGGAQFAALSVLQGGGAVVAAVAAGMLMNARWLPMSFAIAPSLRGGRLRRAAEAQAIVDASFVMSSRGDGTFDRGLLLGATVPQFVSWTTGTAIGVLLAGSVDDPASLGLDAIFPTFYLALLLREAGSRRAYETMLLAGAITIALTTFAPPGVPVIAASAAALLGLRRR
jgi:predicted branched-subunit amino acid permease